MTASRGSLANSEWREFVNIRGRWSSVAANDLKGHAGCEGAEYHRCEDERVLLRCGIPLSHSLVLSQDHKLRELNVKACDIP